VHKARLTSASNKLKATLRHCVDRKALRSFLEAGLETAPFLRLRWLRPHRAHAGHPRGHLPLRRDVRGTPLPRLA